MDDGSTARLAEAFASDPKGAFRALYLEAERLAAGGGADEADEARALAAALETILPSLPLSPLDRARLLHDFAVLLGSPGPAADLAKARLLFGEAREVWAAAGEESDVARSLHNEGNALQSLASGAGDLAEALALYEAALLFRTEERPIARGVTLHAMGSALRRLAQLSKEPLELLVRSEEVLEEAIAIREAEELVEGAALSWFQLGLTLEALCAAGRCDALAPARRAFETSAAAFGRLGRPDEAGVARRSALLVGGKRD